MNYEIKKDSEIVIYPGSDFKLEHIFDCGQVFRYRKDGDCYTLIAKNNICILHEAHDYVIIKTNNTEFFENYFDLKRDYSKIKNELSKFDGLKESLEFGYGIRILNQDLFEMIISFIISANNNIPRIKSIIEKLCEGIGKKENGFYAFPTAEEMSEQSVDFYKSIGAGYRAPYLLDTAKKISSGEFKLDTLKGMNTLDSRRELLKLKGIGGKVADCIELFALHNTDSFPVDTWSKRIYLALGFKEEKTAEQMTKNLVEHFGGLSGYAQQYLFYYYRANQIK